MTDKLRVGSLASGCGALDLALQQVIPNTELVWVCENDKHASSVLAARFPGVPNLHDVTAIDHTAPPVDILIGGLPCQPYSLAGKQKGKADNRDLLPEAIRLARLLEPKLIFLENVSNLVRRPEYRALAGGLAEIGYDLRWTTLRASDIGACHRRERLFAVAYSAQSGREGRGGSEWLEAYRQDGFLASGGVEPIYPTPKNLLVTPTAWLGRRPENSVVGGSGRRGSTGSELIDSLTRIETLGWGQYAEAIKRHEVLMSTPPPEPTDDKKRLNPSFVEWMMCLPAGWVTDIGASSPGFTGPIPARTAQLKILGNAVVPPQAAEAYRRLLYATG